MPALTLASDVVPATLDPTWPRLPTHPELRELTTDERNALPYEATTCPSCTAAIAFPPKGRKKCPACGTYMFVRVLDGDRRRLVTEGQAAELDRLDADRRVAEADRLEHDWYAAVRAVPGVLTADDPDVGESIDVVGESHRHADLAALHASLISDPEQFDAWTVARLVLEPANPYDRNAVRVEIHGRHVGYVGRSEAPEVKRWVGAHGRDDRPVFVVARLAGGRVVDGRVGPIGVILEYLPDGVLG